MALPASLAWEMRADGSDANGGAYDWALASSAGSVDYSRQAAAQVSYTDLVIGATNTQLTSAASPFTAAHVGNVIKITGGTNFTTGRYVVLSVSGGVATMSDPVGTAGSTGGVGKLGGAVASLGELAASMVASNVGWVRGASGAYAQSGAVAFNAAAVTPSPTAPPTRVMGYNTTRGDITPFTANQSSRPAITFSGVGSGTALTGTNSGFHFANLVVAGTSGNALILSGNSVAVNVKVSGFTLRGIQLSTNASAYYCEATGGSGSYGMGGTSTFLLHACHVHDNACPGVVSSLSQTFIDSCIIANNSGASSDGITASTSTTIRRCTIHGNGRDGIRFTLSGYGMASATGNLITGNAGYGINCPSAAGMAARVLWDGNAYYNNTLGARNNLDDGTVGTVHPNQAPGAYTNSRDLILTASPYAGAGDWSLNTTAGGGLAARGVGVPANFPGLSVASYPDYGAYQSQPGTPSVKATGYSITLGADSCIPGVPVRVVAAITGGEALDAPLVVTISDDEAATVSGTITIAPGSFSGSATVTPSAEATHTLSFTHSGGNAGMADPASKTLEVQAADGPPAVADAIYAKIAALGLPADSIRASTLKTAGDDAIDTGPADYTAEFDATDAALATLSAAVAAIPTDKAGYALGADGLDAVPVEDGINARQALAGTLAATAGLSTATQAGSVVTTTYYAAGSAGTGTPRIAAATATTAPGVRTSVTLTLPT